MICSHKNVQYRTVGTRWFADGEVDDDIREVLICDDCGAEVIEMPDGSYEQIYTE